MFALKTIEALDTDFFTPFFYRAKTDLVLVYTGDLEIEGDLVLDWEAGWDSGAIITVLADGAHKSHPQITANGHRIWGLYVEGNLRITGAVVNAEGDYGAMLLVTGTLDARQVSCGGADIRIGGDLQVKEVVYAHYNHGSLLVDGQLFAQALIVDGDHFVDVRSKVGSSKLVYIDLTRLDDDERLPSALKKLLKNSPMSLRLVRDGLVLGRNLASLAMPQTMEEWRDVVWKDYTVLKKIPKELRSETMYLMLLAPQCPLSKLEINELFAAIPAKQLTPAVRRAGFMLAPLSLLRLPAKFDLQREYEECFLALDAPQPFASEIPPHFMSPTMSKHMSMRTGGNGEESCPE